MRNLVFQPVNPGVPDHKVQQRLRGHGKNAFAPGSTRDLVGKSSMSGRLTSEERRELDRRRALAPTLTAAGTGASLAALATNLGGSGMRLVGQKPRFNRFTNSTQWTNRKGVRRGTVRHGVSRVGGRLAGATLPITAIAGGINAAASTNNARSSKLWNKRDKVYDRIERDSAVFKAYESNLSRNRRRNQRAVAATEGYPSVPQVVGTGAIGAGAALGGQAAASGVQYARERANTRSMDSFRSRFRPAPQNREQLNDAIRGSKSRAASHRRAAVRRGKVGAGLALGGGALIAGAEAVNRRAKRNLNTELKPRQLRDGSYIYKSLDVPRQVAGQMLPPPLYNYLKNSTTDAQERRAILAQIEQKPQLLRDGQFIRMATAGLLGLSVLNLVNPSRFSPKDPNELFRGVKR